MANILVVEDDQDILNLMQHRLRKAGHRVAAVTRPEEALELVEPHPPDLVVLDVGLPGMTGLQLLERLRRQPGLDRLSAIFVSARVQEEDIEAGRSMGAVYLTKPFVASALMNAVDRALAIEAEASAPGTSSDPYA